MKIGISSCLLGMKVRYDGGHKHDAYLARTLGAFVEYVPVCPEVECGLSTPREAMRLVGDPSEPRLLGVSSGTDYTERMQQWARGRLDQLEREELCGFIFKSRSPSSGMERVKVYASAARDSGPPRKEGTGIFAKMFMERFPDVPVEEEGRLQDPRLRENFIERVFVMQRFRGLLARLGNKAGVGRVGVGTVAGARSAVGVLVAFHTEHKLLLMSHSIAHYRTMGRLVAAAADIPPAELADRYAALLHEAIALLPTVKKHANVLQHIAGYFKRKLSPDERQELSGIIEQYRTGLVPLIVPVTLLNHYVRKYDDSYLKGQVYLNPHPMELKLRLHA